MEPRATTGEQAVVIIVGDPTARKRIAEGIRRAGAQPMPVSTVEEACEALARERVDLFVIDVDGVVVLEALRCRQPLSAVPALTIAGPEDGDRRKAALRAGATDFLSKGFEDIELEARLRTLTELARLRRSGAADFEAALHASEERNRAFVAAMPDLLFRLDAEGRFVDCIASDPSRLALPQAAFIGKTIAEVFAEEVVGDQFAAPGSFPQELSSAIGRARQTQALQSFEYTFRHRWFEARIVPCGPSEVLAIARDITALKNATRELEQSRARFAFMINEGTAVIYACAPTPPFAASFVSANVVEQLGYRPEDFTNDPKFWLKNLHPEDASRVLADMPRLVESGSHAHEYRFRRKDGEYRWMHDKLRLVRDSSGRDIELVGFWLDITERKRADDALRAAVQARDTLMAIVSHDLRNPLAAILLNANLLSRSALGPQSSASKKPIDTILHASAQMHRLIDDLLDAAMIERGTLTVKRAPEEPTGIVDEALEAIESLAAKKGVRLDKSVPLDLPKIECDRLRILQVLSNLIGNAIKAAAEGKRIEVRVRPQAGSVEFVVEDEGPGIPEEHLPNIFDRYWTGHGGLDRTSAGLGLFIAKGVVEAHGGRLWVETSVGAGAAFFFTIPMA